MVGKRSEKSKQKVHIILDIVINKLKKKEKLDI